MSFGRSRSESFDEGRTITLNVGGVLFQTTRQTLQRYGPNYFEKLLLAPKVDTTPFIDRNPDSFKVILDILRGYPIFEQVPSNLRVWVESDFEFYQLKF